MLENLPLIGKLMLKAKLQGKTIYYIEDNVANQASVQTILERNGGNVIIDNWGDCRLTRFDEDVVDIVIIDLSLKGPKSGFDIGKQILEGEKEIPVLIMSGRDPAEVVEKAKREGYSGFVQKPVPLMKIPEIVQRVLDGEDIWPNPRL